MLRFLWQVRSEELLIKPVNGTVPWWLVPVKVDVVKCPVAVFILNIPSRVIWAVGIHPVGEVVLSHGGVIERHLAGLGVLVQGDYCFHEEDVSVTLDSHGEGLASDGSHIVELDGHRANWEWDEGSLELVLVPLHEFHSNGEVHVWVNSGSEPFKMSTGGLIIRRSEQIAPRHINVLSGIYTPICECTISGGKWPQGIGVIEFIELVWYSWHRSTGQCGSKDKLLHRY